MFCSTHSLIIVSIFRYKVSRDDFCFGDFIALFLPSSTSQLMILGGLSTLYNSKTVCYLWRTEDVEIIKNSSKRRELIFCKNSRTSGTMRTVKSVFDFMTNSKNSSTCDMKSDQSLWVVSRLYTPLIFSEKGWNWQTNKMLVTEEAAIMLLENFSRLEEFWATFIRILNKFFL